MSLPYPPSPLSPAPNPPGPVSGGNRFVLGGAGFVPTDAYVARFPAHDPYDAGAASLVVEARRRARQDTRHVVRRMISTLSPRVVSPLRRDAMSSARGRGAARAAGRGELHARLPLVLVLPPVQCNCGVAQWTAGVKTCHCQVRRARPAQLHRADERSVVVRRRAPRSFFLNSTRNRPTTAPTKGAWWCVVARREGFF